MLYYQTFYLFIHIAAYLKDIQGCWHGKRSDRRLSTKDENLQPILGCLMQIQSPQHCLIVYWAAIIQININEHIMKPKENYIKDE